jgi:hypothetical protein
MSTSINVAGPVEIVRDGDLLAASLHTAPQFLRRSPASISWPRSPRNCASVKQLKFELIAQM